MGETTRPPAGELAEFCVEAAREKLAEDVVALSVGDRSSVADYFIVATATSAPHLKAVADFIERRVRENYSVHLYGGGTDDAGGWILLDFITVVVHVMLPGIRARYRLEELWKERPSEGNRRKNE